MLANAIPKLVDLARFNSLRKDRARGFKEKAIEKIYWLVLISMEVKRSKVMTEFQIGKVNGRSNSVHKGRFSKQCSTENKDWIISHRDDNNFLNG